METMTNHRIEIALYRETTPSSHDKLHFLAFYSAKIGLKALGYLIYLLPN